MSFRIIRVGNMEGKLFSVKQKQMNKKRAEHRRRRREEKSTLARFIEGLVFVVMLIFVCSLAFGLVWYFGQGVSQAGAAMEPTLENGDTVFVNRLIYNTRRPRRGDLVVFRPRGEENTHLLIRRVVAVSGEVVQVHEGNLYINHELYERNVDLSEITYAGIAETPLLLGEHQFFVLGDNPNSSSDSRMADIGLVHREHIYGQAWLYVRGQSLRLLRR